jgi:hypothetical protein
MIAIHPIELPAHPIETPHQNCVAVLIALRIEKAIERCVNNRRLVGSWPVGRKSKTLGDMVGQIDRQFWFHSF